MQSLFRPTGVGLTKWSFSVVACAVVLMLAPLATAYPLTGPGGPATPLGPGATVFPNDLTGSTPGTQVALLPDQAWSTSTGTFGTYSTAVYREASGTLDFYYQVTNDSSSMDAISRVTMTNFDDFMISVGFITNGSSLGAPFVDGVCRNVFCPATADRGSLPNSQGTIGFSFNPPDDAKIQPGDSSFVVIISTNATKFTEGHINLIDGGVFHGNAFQPMSSVPEPASMALIGGGLLALAGIRRFRR